MRMFARLIMLCAAGVGTAALAQATGAPVIGAIVFVDAPAQVLEGGRPAASLQAFADGVPVDVSRVPALQDSRFVAGIAPLVGQPIDGPRLQALAQQVRQHLQARGLRFAQVAVPPQDATSGVLQVVVLQPRIGQVRIEGASHFRDDAYRDALRLKPGETLDAQALDDAMAWLERTNPYRSATATVSAGAKAGEADVTVRVRDQRPWTVRLGADNNGTPSTQRERLLAGFTHGDLFGRGDVGSYILTTSPDAKTFVAHAVDYAFTLPTQTLVALGATQARVRPRLPAPFDQTGHTSTVALRLEQPLRGRPGFTHSLLASAEYKRADSNVLFSSTPVFDNRTAILQFGLAWQLRADDARGRTTAQLAWIASPGGLVGHNDDASFDRTRAGARAQYHVQRVDVDRETWLPAGWSWRAQLRLQNASQNLLGSEQLAVAGASGVRALPEAAHFADRGVLLRNEAGPLLLPSPGVQLQPFVFLDGARGGQVRRVAGERNVHAASAGVGARLELGQRLSLRADLGTVLSTDIPGQREGTWRAHVSAVLQY